MVEKEIGAIMKREGHCIIRRWEIKALKLTIDSPGELLALFK